MTALTALMHRFARALAIAGPTLILFTLQRLVAISAMRWMGGPDWMSSMALRYDASWYLGIVKGGYHEFPRLDESGEVIRTNLAFFPLFPATATAVDRILPVTSEWAVLIVAWTSSLVAAWGLFLIGKHLRGPGAGMALALIWGASTQSIILVMGYAEGLFTALLAFALYSILRDRPLAAAVLAALAGLCRPTAAPLVAVVGLWLIVQIIRKVRDGSSVPHRWWALLLSLVITPLGLAVALANVAIRTGDLLGYFAVQRQWNMLTGSPLGIVRLMRDTLFPESGRVSTAAAYVPVVAGYLLLLVIVAGWLVPRVRAGYGWLATYTIVGVGFALTNQTYFHSIPRHLMSVVTLLLPLLDLRTSRWAVGVILAASSLATSWWGATLIATSTFSP